MHTAKSHKSIARKLLKRWISSALLSLFVLSLSAQNSPQVATEQNRILALENAWNQAVQLKDTAALEMLLGNELIYVDYDGKLMDKGGYLASVQEPLLRPARVVSEAMSVHLFGTTAIVIGVYRENGFRAGRPYSLRERFSDVWVQRRDSWVCVASHSTLINP